MFPAKQEMDRVTRGDVSTIKKLMDCTSQIFVELVNVSATRTDFRVKTTRYQFTVSFFENFEDQVRVIIRNHVGERMPNLSQRTGALHWRGNPGSTKQIRKLREGRWHKTRTEASICFRRDRPPERSKHHGGGNLPQPPRLLSSSETSSRLALVSAS